MSMRHLIALPALAALLLGAAPAPTPPPHAGPESAYVVLLRLRGDLYAKWKETGTWSADPAADAALSGHAKYWAKLRDEGRAILAGGMRGDYWDNVALIIFRADSEEDANALVENDPAVRAHVFQAQVRGFDIRWIGSATSDR